VAEGIGRSVVGAIYALEEQADRGTVALSQP
jgi:hypothetical protein